jgi:hypothetical protein
MEGVVLTSKGIPTRIKDALFQPAYISPALFSDLPTTSAYDAVVSQKKDLI